MECPLAIVGSNNRIGHNHINLYVDNGLDLPVLVKFTSDSMELSNISSLNWHRNLDTIRLIGRRDSHRNELIISCSILESGVNPLLSVQIGFHGKAVGVGKRALTSQTKTTNRIVGVSLRAFKEGLVESHALIVSHADPEISHIKIWLNRSGEMNFEWLVRISRINVSVICIGRNLTNNSEFLVRIHAIRQNHESLC